MENKIMQDWLLWFDNHVRRPVLLLLDNFSAHELGWRTVEAQLRFVSVAWLPPNATAIHQPLDQGIIQNWKCYLRKSFIQFMAKSFDEDTDPLKNMHVLRAIRWGIFAWEQDVSPTTIQHCWTRSKAIPSGLMDEDVEMENNEHLAVIDELQHDINRLHHQGRIQKAMDISNFINPLEESMEDSQEDIMEQIVARYTSENEEGSDEDTVHEELISLTDASKALSKLQLFEAQRKQSNGEFSKMFRSYEKDLSALQRATQRQQTLTSWLQ
jgi:hypothetical protein